MTHYLTLPLKKSVLMARVSAMTAKAADIASADETAKRAALIQKVTGSPEDTMLLSLALRSAIDAFSVFVAGEAFGIQHISDTLTDDKDDFLIEMDRPPRFNEAMRQPLVSQVSDYIVRSMLFQWYSAFSSEVAQQQSAVLPNIQYNIARCFRKVDSTPLKGLFADSVKLNQASVPDVVCVGDTFDIRYTIEGLSPQPVNDIRMDMDPHTALKVRCELKDDRITVHAISDGIVSLLVYSQHDDSVNDVITFSILPNV